MRVLITGVAGFIGFHVAKTLAQRGDTVIGVDNLNDSYDPQLKKARLLQLGIMQQNFKNGASVQSSRYPNLKFIKLDITLQRSLVRVFDNHDIDAVCHLAAQAGNRNSLCNPHPCVQSNLVGFTNMLECTRHAGIKNFCYASSASVYGLNKSSTNMVEHSTNHPVSIYAATKKSNELLAHTYSHLYGISTTGLRYFSVYGPWGRPDMAAMLFTRSILSSESITVYNRGDMWRDFTYIDDAVHATIAILDKPSQRDIEWQADKPTPASSDAPFRLFNIGNSNPVRLGDFISYLEKTLGKEAIIHYKPAPKDEVIKTHADVRPLRDYIGNMPSTQLSDGILDFVTWYKSYHAQHTWLQTSTQDAS